MDVDLCIYMFTRTIFNDTMLIHAALQYMHVYLYFIYPYSHTYHYDSAPVGEEQHWRLDLLKKPLQKIRVRLGEPTLRSGLILGLQLWRQCRVCWVKRFNIIIATCLSEC